MKRIQDAKLPQVDTLVGIVFMLLGMNEKIYMRDVTEYEDSWRNAILQLHDLGWMTDEDGDGALRIADVDCEGWLDLRQYWRLTVRKTPFYTDRVIREGLLPYWRDRSAFWAKVQAEAKVAL